VSLEEELSKCRIYDLGRPLESSTPTSPNHVPFRMALIRRHGDVVRADGSSGANELISLSGHTGTHIDALCHVALDGRLHDGSDALEASRGGRFRTLGAETIQPIFCAGILLDVPTALNIDALEGGRRITASDLEAACRHHGVGVPAGGAVLIRTGWPDRRYSDPVAIIGQASGVPGPDLNAAMWLSDHRVRFTGADTIAYEWLGEGAGHTQLPVHAHFLVQEGIHIIELLDLEQLARDHAYQFTFVAIPLKLMGATGSPLRPLALVRA
jgi:kynurenine formamidase